MWETGAKNSAEFWQPSFLRTSSIRTFLLFESNLRFDATFSCEMREKRFFESLTPVTYVTAGNRIRTCASTKLSRP